MFRSPTDRWLRWVSGFCALSGAAVLTLVVGYTLVESLPAFRQIGWRPFLQDSAWYPTQGEFQMLPMVIASALVTVGAVGLAVPVGIASALFSRFFAPPLLGALYQRLLEVMGGIPSVVFGLWGLIDLVPLLQRLRPPGTSVAAGILVLGLMILPTMALSARAAIDSVPQRYLHTAAALGLSRWSTLLHIVLPTARPGIVAGLLLSLARAAGETMVVLMVCGNVVQTPHDLLTPVRTLTANIALEMPYALDVHRSSLFVSGLLLIAVVGILITAADRVSRRSRDHG